ncbi:MAG: RluA family pseudouridine synthase [Clostridia bacterium]|nr:RluA family pseudouridine synthase [Clostridia bacterium]
MAVTYHDIPIIYEDNHIIVVVKPFNVPSQEDASKDPDMLSLLKEYLRETYDKQGNVYLGLVHRLDRPTGGVMVFAKTSKAAERLCESITSGDFEKRYFAVLSDVPREKRGRLENYLAKDEVKNIVSVVPMTVKGAKQAVLDYKILEKKEPLCLADIHLYTGRSHQIRVQTAYIGCPIVGDQKYAGKKYIRAEHLALWSTEIKFTHPTKKEVMVFRAFPDDTAFPWSEFDIERHLSIKMN